MTEKKPPVRNFQKGFGTVPEPTYELSESEFDVYSRTFKDFPHLKERDAEFVAQYAVQTVLIRELSRHVSQHGVTAETRRGGVRRTAEAITLDNATQAVASLERRLALTEDSQRKAGIGFNDENINDPWIELASRRAIRTATRFGLSEADTALLVEESVALLFVDDVVRMGAESKFLQSLEVAHHKGEDWWELTNSLSGRSDLKNVRGVNHD